MTAPFEELIDEIKKKECDIVFNVKEFKIIELPDKYAIIPKCSSVSMEVTGGYGEPTMIAQLWIDKCEGDSK